MVDPKYANLPGIAYDQPDIYESTEAAETDTTEQPCEEENDSVERLHISFADCHMKFRDKYLSGNAVDFSDRLKKVPNRGYDARSLTWELASLEEKETPLQKYQRLQCEVNELVEEVSVLKEIKKEHEKEEAMAYKQLYEHIQETQKQLANFKLEEVLGKEMLSSLKNPEMSQIRKLMAQLELYDSKSGEKLSKAPGKDEGPSGAPGTLTYELRVRPHLIELQKSTRLAKLEQRLQKLESVLGANSDSLSRLGAATQSKSIVNAVKILEDRLSLLDKAQLGEIESRLATVSQTMDTISEKASARNAIDPEKEAKISELYEIIKKTEPITNVLPQFIERLRALERLHHQASEFATSLSKLEGLQSGLTNNLDANHVLLKSIEKSFSENVESMKKNMADLDTRLKAVSKK